ncbi:elongation factor G [Nitratidesulfovibrio vulgaris]|jgi:elongation factor G|uniref:Elongation factor G n=2 Tax=Nitratidesulfovibrio vulgaris TaxID=881 RepID=Q72DP8_NITV2|nr:elongation factor G [Nitratidesulfovibrio vulgaris]GEB81290.1 elongation factor G [Desulfovibrio desulfuricans]HBW14748.1 elongation factor G [Desulfovibrio sp.]AAS95361.1 translation elongation factor G, putative [Nitratidesulfovibrio vulgaris str. Hildenborough]ABM29119.1 translation elongation factor 2 (EF-2/EF-G) [Nitratidesulfovibrio vulgaris DP4]ADP85974.1 small GTP-binding protein [Nitratidesulfovibrio vulgaris RCH1]
MSKALETQRTYALVGTGGCGKTSLAEMLLYRAGVVNRLGRSEEGTTTLDYEPEEVKRRGSIQPAFATWLWNRNRHFLVDIPGDTNFIGDIGYLLTGVDAAVFVIDAVDGVRPLTKKLWKAVRDASLPAIVCINKLDRDRADFNMAFNGLASTLGMKPVLLYVPIGGPSDFRGVVDVMADKALMFGENGAVTEAPVPDDLAEEVAILRETTIENIAESDETLMEKYLEEGVLSPDELAAGLRKGVLSGDLVPVVVAAALEDKGGVQLLDTIDALFPSPLDRPAWVDAEGNERASTDEAPAACFVFKTLADPFAGQLNMVRILSGTISTESTLKNMTTGDPERLGSLAFMVGKTQTPCKEALGPGAIVAVAKLKGTRTGDTLCDEKAPFVLPKPALPPQLISYALAPKEKGEEDKVFAAMHKLLDEDVTLRLSRDGESSDILVSGMGQLHIELSVEKARRRYKAEILLKTPKIPYREALRGKAQVQGRHKKQSGGRGQFGDCWIEIEGLPRGTGYVFEDAIVGGSIPRQYIPAVDKGVQEAAARGYLAGFPVVDFKVKLYDGSYHTVDSSEMAFKIAGSIAFKKAMEMVKPVLLEPLVLLTVSVPDEFMGDVIGDLSSRRGKVLGSDSVAGLTEIKAHVPMSEVLRYAPDLRSMTGGQGLFTMEFDHYEEAPPPVAEKVIAEHAKERAEA